jgi:protein SCO1/2
MIAACGRAAGQGAYQGTALMGAAPDFSLTDQAGRTWRLSGFQGQVVVLAFLDGQCQDVCPRVAHDLGALHTALGERAGRVALVGVNVNLAAGAQADLARASQAWGLDQVPNWHFLSGPPEALADVWADYNIAVTPAPQEPGRVVHTAGVFIIDASGGWRWYILPPGDDDPAGGLADLLRAHVLGLLSEAGPTD